MTGVEHMVLDVHAYLSLLSSYSNRKEAEKEAKKTSLNCVFLYRLPAPPLFYTAAPEIEMPTCENKPLLLSDVALASPLRDSQLTRSKPFLVINYYAASVQF